MVKSGLPVALLMVVLSWNFASGQANYLSYHRAVVSAEQMILGLRHKEAIQQFDSLFAAFEFVFLRDCKLATEIALHLGDQDAAFRFLQRGILSGWTKKEIRKNTRLKALHQDPRWDALLQNQDSLFAWYESRLDPLLRKEIKALLKKDQKMALGALLRIGEKAQTSYNEKKFAPHSEKQVMRLRELIREKGYPGEKLIGNGWWASVILSHHNSISPTYAAADSLYPGLKPLLLEAIEKGELHPVDFAVIQDWRTAVLSHHDKTTYGYLGKISGQQELDEVDQHRHSIGLRTVAQRNALLDFEKETGVNLYLPKDWQKGKIEH